MPNRRRAAERPVEMLFEGDADTDAVEVPIVARDPDAEVAGSEPHVVGTDRLGSAVAAVNDTMEQLRVQRAEAQMAGGMGGTRAPLFPERTAQVIQATQVALAQVLRLLGEGVATPSLRLDDTVAVPKDGIAIFSGRLRMRLSPLPRRVELRVYPTASANLTVLELLPKRRWIPQTERYLRAGVPAVTDLTDRIESAARPA